jgi:hypothetical protein
MAKAAHSEDLRAAFEKHRSESQGQVRFVFESHMPRHAVEITAQITRIRSRAARIDIRTTLLQRVASETRPEPALLLILPAKQAKIDGL